MLMVSGGEKGGTGKTMLATNLAVCLSLQKRDVLLVDADPQRSSARWAEGRKLLTNEALPPWVTRLVKVPWVELHGDIYDPLIDLKGRYQDVVVDVGGADSVEFRTALLAADRLWSPFLPSDCDLQTAKEVNQVVSSAKAMNRALDTLVLLNAVSPQFRERDEAFARERLEPFPYLPVAPTALCQRDAFRHAFNARLGVVEMFLMGTRRVREGAQKAAEEMWGVYAAITVEVVHAAAE